MRFVLICCFLILTRLGYSQVASCDCEGIIDPEYKQAIMVLDKPDGKVIKQLRHHFTAEDFLVWHFDRQQGSYFHGKVSYAISGKSYQGWVSQSKWLGIYARNYSNTALALYAAPLLKSPVKILVPNNSAFYPVRQCRGRWLYVRLGWHGKVYQGWLPPDMQCANPYTTCS